MIIPNSPVSSLSFLPIFHFSHFVYLSLSYALLQQIPLLRNDLSKSNHHNHHHSIYSHSSQLHIIYHLSINTLSKQNSTHFLILIINFHFDTTNHTILSNHLYRSSSYENVSTILLSHYTQSIQSFILSINHYIHSLPSFINSFIFSNCISQ